MRFVFIVAAFNSLFFSFLLVQKRRRARHDNILMLWLIYLGLFIGAYSYFSHDLFTNFKLLSVSFISLFLLLGPFLYLYISSLTSFGKGLRITTLLHVLPFVLFNLYLLIVSFYPEVSERITLEHVSGGGAKPFIFVMFLILTLLSGPGYILFSVRLFRKHEVNLSNIFSFEEEINLSWLRIVVYLFGIVWSLLIMITVIHHVLGFFSMTFCTDGLFLTLSVFVILTGYFGLRQREIFTDQPEGINRKEGSIIKYAGSRLSEKDAEKYRNDLTGIMVTSKPYLNPELTLAQLADEVGISAHYMSQVINEQLNMSFFDFINQHRVEEVKARLKEPAYDNYSLLGIALDSGFNSKSAFNRIFKKVTGHTPSQYKALSSQS